MQVTDESCDGESSDHWTPFVFCLKNCSNKEVVVDHILNLFSDDIDNLYRRIVDSIDDIAIDKMDIN